MHFCEPQIVRRSFHVMEPFSGRLLLRCLQACEYVSRTQGVTSINLYIHVPPSAALRRWCFRLLTTDENTRTLRSIEKKIKHSPLFSLPGLEVRVVLRAFLDPRNILMCLPSAVCYLFTLSVALAGRYGVKFYKHIPSLELNGIDVGRHAAATLLRKNNSLGGKFSFGLAALMALLEGLLVYIYAEKISKKFARERDACFLIDHAYNNALFPKTLNSLHGWPMVILSSPYGQCIWKLSSSVLTGVTHHSLAPKRQINLTNAEYAEYFEKRISNPGSVLPYMSTGFASPSPVPPLLPVDGIVAVVFLHSFQDAQYENGCDGFRDLFEWTCVTIQSLHDNPCVSAVVIKPHPNIDYEAYPADRVAMARLIEFCKFFKKVQLVKRNVPLRMLVEAYQCLVGVTHHGSVAEELIYMNIQCIASSFSPWGSEYLFALIWKSKDEYLKILASFSPQFRPVSLAQKKELYRWLKECRLGSYSAQFPDSGLIDLQRLLSGLCGRSRAGVLVESLIKSLTSSEISRLVATRR